MILFIRFQKFIYLLQGLLVPALRILPPLRKRLRFEQQNVIDENPEKHHICFEVSSEGELQQISPILEYFLENRLKVELIFSSSSVESKVLKLLERYPNQLRILRYPFLTKLDLSKWMTAKTLVLCRYDFFPELLIMGAKKEVKFILLSASVKLKRLRSHSLRGIYWKHLFSLFDLIVTTSEEEKVAFEQLGLNPKRLESFEFRNIQILKRLETAQERMEKTSFGEGLQRWLHHFKNKDRLILGSAWISDLEIFKDPELKKRIQEKKLAVVVAPHKLDSSFLNNIQSWFQQNGYQCEIHGEGNREFTEINIVSLPGILVELYSYFGNCYVGGGFERSIHSVLEPYLAGCSVICGPKTHRSTEFRYICSLSPEKISRLHYHNEFYPTLMDHMNSGVIYQTSECFQSEQIKAQTVLNRIEELTYQMRRSANP